MAPATCRSISPWRKGYFAEDASTSSSSPSRRRSGHTNAVLSGQAFAFIGGPEHDAFAKIKGAELRSVVNCVDRGNVYFVRRKGMEPQPGQDLRQLLQGQALAIGPFGGTPNSITRYLLKKWNLDAKNDVTLIETATIPRSSRRSEASRPRSATRPSPISRKACAKTSGASRSSTCRRSSGLTPIRPSTSGSNSIKKEPEVVRGFVRGMVKGLKFLYANQDEAAEIAKKQFPTMPLDDLKATLDRSFADEMWSKDGMSVAAAWDTAKAW